jgi:ribose transport system ATP-binding protein
MTRLTIHGLSKAFAAPVLREVSLSIAPGEIHGLVGENGAGKSTLINIVTGVLPRDAGELLLDGEAYRPRRPRDATRAGIAVVSQELSLVDTLDVADNLLLRRLPSRWGLVRRGEAAAESAALLDKVGLTGVRPDTSLSALSLSERQLLEFAKAIAQPSRLLILDEPTAALTAPQAERLHRILAEMAADGAAILYVSHRLEDVRAVCDRVSVLRDGEITRTADTPALSVAEMIEAMSGRKPLAATPGVGRAVSHEPLLTARAVTTRGLPHPIDLDLHGGEIVGVAGLAGSGRTELLEALSGMAPLRSGQVMRHGGSSPVAIGSQHQAVANRVGLLTEDRKASGIFAGQSVRFNMSLAALAGRAPGGIVDRADEGARVADLIAALRIRCNGPDQDIAELSGGNQQKVLFARWMMRGVEVLLLDEPTRGVDVGSKFDIHAEIRKLAAAGCAVLVVSSEIEELTALADRIIVLSGKRRVAQFDAPPPNAGSGAGWDVGPILEAAFIAHVGERGAADADRGNRRP